jgi:hypothetical protein
MTVKGDGNAQNARRGVGFGASAAAQYAAGRKETIPPNMLDPDTLVRPSTVMLAFSLPIS